MTPLDRLIRDRIAADGPLPLDLYMDLCLAHPEHGYYRTRDPLGRAGDFVTAPEVSQIFGELIGLWAAQTLIDQQAAGAPRIDWIELGPGRGALTRDALRALAKAAPPLFAALDVTLVETSEPLRRAQAAALADRLAPGRALRWVDTVAAALAAADAPLIVIANEFFDALPIRQHVFRQGAWRERRVDIREGRLTPVLGPARTDRAADDDRLPAPADGAVLEDSPASQAVARDLGAALATRPGVALIIDYGYDHALLREAGGRDTFQAVRAHRKADPFEAPGEADLTAHVDFDALAAAARPAIARGPIGQGNLLRALGAEPRAAALARANPARAEAVAAGLHRLTHPAEMGRIFKALALAPPSAPPPPGFPPTPTGDLAP